MNWELSLGLGMKECQIWPMPCAPKPSPFQEARAETSRSCQSGRAMRHAWCQPHLHIISLNPPNHPEEVAFQPCPDHHIPREQETD